MQAKDLMTKNVETIDGMATVGEAINLLKEKNVRDLIVKPRDKNDAYGIITETDIVYKVLAFDKNPRDTKVHEIMTKPLIVINPDLDIKYVARLFRNTHTRRAPVIKGELLGIVSVTDIIQKI